METAALPAFAPWSNFYVIVGSSAGALIGLQFVVITLVAEAQAVGSLSEIRAFGSPTVVHFCAALLISAIMSVPWERLFHAGISLGVFGAAGLAYSVMVIRHARKQTHYSPDIEDWFWYVALPLVAYAGLAGEGTLLSWNVRWSFFAIGATALLFLIIGIHNAWDTVTYVAVQHREKLQQQKEQR